MILGNKTLMCPLGSGVDRALRHDTPIIIMTRLSWNSYGPTVVISLTCPDCGWKANKEISLLRMMERASLCPTTDTSKTGSKGS